MRKLAVKVPPEISDVIDELTLHLAVDSVVNAIAWERRLRVVLNSLGETYGFAVDEDASQRRGRPVRKYVFEKPI